LPIPVVHDENPRAMDRTRRLVTIAVALASAALLAIAVQGGRWWQVGDFSIGPVSSHRCFDGDCRVVGLGWVGASEGWARAGMATYAAALCTAALLVISAAALASRRVIKAIARSGLVAAITAATAAGVFVALFPGGAGTTYGRGAWFHAAGVVLAIAVQLSVVRMPTPTTPPPAT
jgi:hypothetical protein